MIGTVDLSNKREILGKYNEALTVLGGNASEVTRVITNLDWSAYCALIDSNPDHAMKYFDALAAQFVLKIGEKAQELKIQKKAVLSNRQ